MKQLTLRLSVLALTFALVGVHPLLVAAQGDATSSTLLSRSPLLKVFWSGPASISPHEAIQSNYTNLGAEAVRIEWAITNAETGDVVCSNFGKPTTVMPGKGILWVYQQTLETIPNPDKPDGPPIQVEVRDCGDKRTVEEPGEVYFNQFLRHSLVLWSFVMHESETGLRNAVDLVTSETFNNMIMSDGTRSMTYGRTLAFIPANPTAPAAFPKALFQR